MQEPSKIQSYGATQSQHLCTRCVEVGEVSAKETRSREAIVINFSRIRSSFSDLLFAQVKILQRFRAFFHS
jgi:hypothetical protein